MKLKYKVGDVVKVKSLNFFINHPDYDKRTESVCKGSHFIIEPMEKSCGKKCIVDAIFSVQTYSSYQLKYYLSKSLMPFSFNDWMLDNMVKEKIKLL